MVKMVLIVFQFYNSFLLNNYYIKKSLIICNNFIH